MNTPDVNLIKNESFSLADGLLNSGADWGQMEIAVPLDLTETTVVFEAPSESITTTLGINPIEIASPVTTAPPVSADDITAPTEETESAAASTDEPT